MSLTAYPTYDSYKDSGEGWIEDVPSHWETNKLKQLFKEKKHRPNLAINCGSISFGEVVEKDDERVPLATKASYQEVSKGEFLVNPLNLNYDLKSLRIGLSDIDVVVSAGYLILQAYEDMDKQFFKYLLHRYDVAYMKLLGSGVRQTISFNHIANSILVAPPLPEQRAIAAFLDRKCAGLDEAVRIKEAQIALLRERRQILIQQAVTRGLTPSAPMKDSGIDWIGQIPAHWEVKRNKHLFVEINERSPRGEEQHLSMSQKLGLVPANLVERSLTSESYQGAKLVKEGDLVLNRLKAHLAVFSLAPMEGLVSPDYSVFRSFIHGVASDYFELLFKTSKYLGEFRLRVRGIVEGFYRLYTNDFMDCPLLLPPLDEQLAIVQHVRETSKRFQNVISIKEDQIAALKEYKNSLINAAVTGKIKVV